jgi:catechol 2,3-dioxygenase-like lactoylglutathione lyase family enzyme
MNSGSRLLRRAGLIGVVLVLQIAAIAQQPIAVAVDAVGMTVSDMDRSVDFYSRVLKFTKLSDNEVTGENVERLKGVFGVRARVVRMRLGGEQIELTEYLAPRGRSIPEDSRSNDRWFQHVAIIVRNMDKAYAWLRQNKVQHASSGPQRLPSWNPNAGGIKAFYFRDPDGHNLEILQFPAGKGDAKWQRPGDDLFMGVDHTAIVVGDTDRSLAFYRDTLGMRVAGESENYGTEQEHLNNVHGARLRITALRAQSGPGIELLEYIAPRDGRSYPRDLRANDVAHWETVLRASDLTNSWEALRGARSEFVSSGVEETLSGMERVSGFLVKDPDGHVLGLLSPQPATAQISNSKQRQK